MRIGSRERTSSGPESNSTNTIASTSSSSSSSSSQSSQQQQRRRFGQCLSIELYNLQTDEWSEIKLNDNSLLSHHIFHSYYQYNRQRQQSNNHRPNLAGLIRLQLVQSRSLCALKNLIYVLNEDCIHCYQLTDANAGGDTCALVCLPYFRLPFNLSQFILGSAVSVSINDPSSSYSSSCAAAAAASASSTSSSTTTNHSNKSNNNNSASSGEVVSFFSWLSDSDEPSTSTAAAAAAIAHISSSSSSSSSSTSSSSSESTPTTELGADEAAASFSRQCRTTSKSTQQQHQQQHQPQQREKEALIYLINPTKSLLYEFYPAKNKFKKLTPQLNLRHHTTETYIISINSKLYVTGGYYENDDDDDNGDSAIEVLDTASNTWSIFAPRLNASSTVPLDSAADGADENGNNNEADSRISQLPVIRRFFKLKISIV